jgi:hypothetical protein
LQQCLGDEVAFLTEHSGTLVRGDLTGCRRPALQAPAVRVPLATSFGASEHPRGPRARGFYGKRLRATSDAAARKRA